MNELPTIQLYSSLHRAYEHFNKHLFGDSLPHCLLTVQRQPKMMGYASHARWVNQAEQFTDELAINPEYFLGGTILSICQTLVHEQCHIWQYHHGKPSRRKYHNTEWAEKMESLGLMPSHTGLPGGKRTGERMADYALESGRFLTAARELLENGFHLPWIDRRGVNHESSQAIFSLSGKTVALTGTDTLLATRIMGNDITTLPKQCKSFQLQEVSDQLRSAPNPSKLKTSLQIVPAIKKATRATFRCECCGARAWGRPSLNIICGECKIPYILVDDSMEDQPWQQPAKSNGQSKRGIR